MNRVTTPPPRPLPGRWSLAGGDRRARSGSARLRACAARALSPSPAAFRPPCSGPVRARRCLIRAPRRSSVRPSVRWQSRVAAPGAPLPLPASIVRRPRRGRRRGEEEAGRQAALRGSAPRAPGPRSREGRCRPAAAPRPAGPGASRSPPPVRVASLRPPGPGGRFATRRRQRVRRCLATPPPRPDRSLPRSLARPPARSAARPPARPGAAVTPSLRGSLASKGEPPAARHT